MDGFEQQVSKELVHNILDQKEPDRVTVLLTKWDAKAKPRVVEATFENCRLDRVTALPEFQRVALDFAAARAERLVRGVFQEELQERGSATLLTDGQEKEINDERTLITNRLQEKAAAKAKENNGSYDPEGSEGSSDERDDQGDDERVDGDEAERDLERVRENARHLLDHIRIFPVSAEACSELESGQLGAASAAFGSPAKTGVPGIRQFLHTMAWDRALLLRSNLVMLRRQLQDLLSEAEPEGSVILVGEIPLLSVGETVAAAREQLRKNLEPLMAQLAAFKAGSRRELAYIGKEGNWSQLSIIWFPGFRPSSLQCAMREGGRVCSGSKYVPLHRKFVINLNADLADRMTAILLPCINTLMMQALPSFIAGLKREYLQFVYALDQRQRDPADSEAAWRSAVRSFESRVDEFRSSISGTGLQERVARKMSLTYSTKWQLDNEFYSCLLAAAEETLGSVCSDLEQELLGIVDAVGFFEEAVGNLGWNRFNVPTPEHPPLGESLRHGLSIISDLVASAIEFDYAGGGSSPPATPPRAFIRRFVDAWNAALEERRWTEIDPPILTNALRLGYGSFGTGKPVVFHPTMSDSTTQSISFPGPQSLAFHHHRGYPEMSR